WGKDFKFAPFIASWVTPHDDVVEDILAQAKELMPGRRLPGYEEWKPAGDQEHSTFQQARAIYRTLQKLGISYVKSSTNFGSNEMTPPTPPPHPPPTHPPPTPLPPPPPHPPPPHPPPLPPHPPPIPPHPPPPP